MQITLDKICELARKCGVSVKYDTETREFYIKEDQDPDGEWKREWGFAIQGFTDKILSRHLALRLSRDELAGIQTGTGLLVAPREPADIEPEPETEEKAEIDSKDADEVGSDA